MSNGIIQDPKTQDQVPQGQDQLLQQLLKRMTQPKMAGPQVQPEMKQPHQIIVPALFGMIMGISQKNKQTQVDHATARIKSIGDAITDAYEIAQGDEQKAHQIFMNSPSVKALQSKEGLKDLKQMEKLLQYDFLNPEKKKTVWHEGLERVAKLIGAEKAMEGIRKLMGQHKDRMAQQAQQSGDLMKQQTEGKQLSETMFGAARPMQGQMTVAQELKTMMDSVKEERTKLNQDRTAFDRETAFAEKTKEFDALQAEKKREFDQKEKDFDRRETAIEENRRQMVKMARDRLNMAGANNDLRRLTIGLNYAPQLLKPGEAAMFGMQVDEEGNLIPAKSPLAATNQTRQASQQAGVMDNLIDTTLKLLDSPTLQNKLGPYSGRMSEIMQGKIGSNVPEFDLLRTLGSFDNSGMLKLHFGARGGQQMYDKFKNLLDTGKMDIASLRETLQGYKTVSSTYKKEVQTVRDKNKPADSAPTGEVVIDLTKPH